MEHSIGVALGILTGVAAAIICAAFFQKATHKDGSFACKYDERQLINRGKGFKYGFIFLVVYNGLYGIYTVLAEPAADIFTTMVIGIAFSVGVQVSYCIWHDAYFSLNENRGMIMILLAADGLLNIGIGAHHLIDGTCFTNGILNFRSSNLFMGIMILTVFLVLALKNVRDRRAKEQEEV